MPKISRTTLVYPITLREVQVARVEDLNPGLRRVTLSAPQLGPFTSESGLELEAFRSHGFDDVVRLFFLYPGGDRARAAGAKARQPGVRPRSAPAVEGLHGAPLGPRHPRDRSRLC